MANTYINFIGTDGSGKDTIFNLIKDTFPNALLTREPGGSIEAEEIRNVILDVSMNPQERIEKIKHIQNMNINKNTFELLLQAIKAIRLNGIEFAEPFLYAASRCESIEKCIAPALDEGRPVLGRRSVACSVAYQGYAREFGEDYIWNLNFPIIKENFPTLEIFFDLPIEVALKRLSGRTEKQDRLDLESTEFFQKVRDGYLNYYKKICPYPYIIIDATKSIAEIHQEVLDILKQFR